MSSYRRGRQQPQTTIERNDAVIYLRVSTPRQTETASDIDADGLSIASQRKDCLAKAHEIGKTVVKEFIDPGRSAQSIETRPAFKEMLAYVAKHPSVDTVIVDISSRAFRNTKDFLVVKYKLKAIGIRLINTKVDYGDTPEGDFMELITAGTDELTVKKSGRDIKNKMGYKAKNGGTISRTPIGYLNVRIDIGGRQVNSVALDEERAPLVKLCFELYATGDYTIGQLAEAMEDHGLRARPSTRWPASRPLSRETLRRILADPYYVGYTYYDGELHDGRHEAIVDQALFDRVQDVLDARSTADTRQRVLKHYLKGSVRCDRCHQAGRIRRLIYRLIPIEGVVGV